MWVQITSSTKLDKGIFIASNNPDLDSDTFKYVIKKVEYIDMGGDIFIFTYINKLNIGNGFDSASAIRITNKTKLINENWFVNFRAPRSL